MSCDYKPLTDEELDRMTVSGILHILKEQARRANAIIDALKRHHPYCDDLHDEVVQAIAAYLGEAAAGGFRDDD